MPNSTKKLPKAKKESEGKPDFDMDYILYLQQKTKASIANEIGRVLNKCGSSKQMLKPR